MAQRTKQTRNEDARYASPIIGVVDPLGYLEVAGPIPAEEMGLHPRRRVRLVGTAYDPNTVGDAYVQLGATPRYLTRNGGGDTRARRPSRRNAYQDREVVRVAQRGEETRVLYRLHEPDLAGHTVAMVTDVERHAVPFWLLLPALAAACVVGVVVGAVMGWRDPHAVRGSYVGKTMDEMRAGLSAEVDWNSMEISVASKMVVAEGETVVEARLENVEANHCDQRVRIYETDDPSDVLYESGAIAPGEYVQHIELAHPLSVGTHDVTVEFQGYERGVTLLSDEGIPLGHNTFGASCAAEVSIYCAPRGVLRP